MFNTKVKNITTYAYINFDECVKENNELQRKLNVEVDESESKRMCRGLYFLFFNPSL